MAKKRNQLRNTPKEETTSKKKTTSKKRSSGKRLKNPLASPIGKVKDFLQDDRFRKITGLLLVLTGTFIGVAITSYLFTWQTDQDLLAGNIANPEFGNWFGGVGAHVSHHLVNNWFGIASYAFVAILFVLGIRLQFRFKLVALPTLFKYSLFLLLWISILMGWLYDEELQFLGGAFGYRSNQWLEGLMGNIGIGFILFFSAAVFIIVNFNPSLSVITNMFSGKDDDEDDDEFIPEDELAARNTMREEEVVPDDIQPTVEFEVGSEAEVATEEPVVEGPELEMEIEVEVPDSGLEMEVEMPVEEPVIEEEGVLDLSTDLPTPEPVADGTDDFGLEVTVPKEEEILDEEEIADKAEEFGEYDPTLDLSSYELPPIEMLEAHGGAGISVDKEELEANKNRIIETLRNYKIEISKIKATIGPTVTLYEIVPAPGVRIAKIKNLEDDIALSLAALGIRIIAPIPGKGTIGIEVPNSKPDIVSMRSVIASDKFQNTDHALPIALGKTISNETFVTDLAKMPHLLMAGATGQGKSVGLNAILVSLLYKKHPSQIKFVLVDPKKVELTLFNKIERHFLAKLPDDGEAIITDTSKVVATVNSLCIEMDDRYELLKNAQCRNIKEYNAKFVARKLNPENGHKYMPYIVLVVDEFADLIMTAGKEVEQPIARLAQLARAIGIHLIIATQRPSVNIITGTIKANFPARIAFRVTSKIDSRTILDAGGADQLIGRGDMLLSTGSEIIRLQCAFVDTPEVEEITDFIGNQRAYPSAFLLPEYVDESGEGSGPVVDEERDVKFDDAARIVVLHQQGSTSLLQRKLKLGYNRAGRIIDQLEVAGIIGPFEGSKARKVLVPDEYSLEKMLNADAAERDGNAEE